MDHDLPPPSRPRGGMRGPRFGTVAHDPLRAGSTAFRPSHHDAREASNDADAGSPARPSHVTSFTSSYDADGRRGPISLKRRNNLIYGACAIALMAGIVGKSAFDQLSGPNLNTEDAQDVERTIDTSETPSTSPAINTTPLAMPRVSGTNDTNRTSGHIISAPVLPNAQPQPTANASVITDPSQSEAIPDETSTIPPVSHRCVAHPHWTGCRAMIDAHQRALDAAMVVDNDETVLDLTDTDTHTLARNDTWSRLHKHFRALRRHGRPWDVSNGHH